METKHEISENSESESSNIENEVEDLTDYIDCLNINFSQLKNNKSKDIARCRSKFNDIKSKYDISHKNAISAAQIITNHNELVEELEKELFDISDITHNLCCEGELNLVKTMSTKVKSSIKTIKQIEPNLEPDLKKNLRNIKKNLKKINDSIKIAQQTKKILLRDIATLEDMIIDVEEQLIELV